MFVVCGTQHWRAELPPGWCAQNGRGNVPIYLPEGVGVLQISSFRKSEGDVSKTDLQEMAEGLPADANGLQPAAAVPQPAASPLPPMGAGVYHHYLSNPLNSRKFGCRLANGPGTLLSQDEPVAAPP